MLAVMTGESPEQRWSVRPCTYPLLSFDDSWFQAAHSMVALCSMKALTVTFSALNIAGRAAISGAASCTFSISQPTIALWRLPRAKVLLPFCLGKVKLPSRRRQSQATLVVHAQLLGIMQCTDRNLAINWMQL